ncbi:MULTISPECIES: transcription-repair coupling factor [unclassified Adlercreutzia]|uniref:transcription-repair coupling factor n=1 Tax=unclassified Adlercreutzia TaxID=2636013 RepID=UPI001F150EC3|nr:MULTISPECIES: transcription-repair coupling factor [unclassified Adlercreutzia]
MLIDSLTFALEKAGCLDAFWGKLDAGEDSTLGVASSARPFLVAARFAHAPQPTLVVVAGEEASIAFARNVAAYLGEEHVLRFPDRTDYPFAPKPANARVVAQRMEAAHALRTRRACVVVASARSLVRCLAPADAGVEMPVALQVGCELRDMGVPGLSELGDLTRALEARGYANTGELDGPGTFCVRGGTVDVFPGNLVYPVRLDFFGDELDEIRRIVPSTGQTVGMLDAVEVYPVREFACTPEALARARRSLRKVAPTNPALRDVLEKLDGGLRFDGVDVLMPYLYQSAATLGDYAGAGVLTTLIEPRSLFDDAQHLYDDLAARAKGTGIALAGLFAEPAHVSFGTGTRATYVSIMRVGGSIDEELPVKRVDVAGNPDKLFGKLRNLIDAGYTCVFSAPGYRAREDMKLAFVDHGLPIQEQLEGEAREASGRGGAKSGETREAAGGGGADEGRAQSLGQSCSHGSAAGASGSCGTRLVSAAPAGAAPAGVVLANSVPSASNNASSFTPGAAAPAHASSSPSSASSHAPDARHAKAVARRKLWRACVNVVDAAVPLGMIIPKAKLAIVSISDTQGTQSAARVRRTVDITEVTFPYKPGDYVVHAGHGVAFFRELVRREIDGTARDYLLLEYAQGDKLFVPVEQLDRVTRYVGLEGASPRLTRLNTSDWSRALAKARKATKKLAFDLVDVYARRAATQGFRFAVDTPWQREMEEAFPYQETPDQLAAIADVKADMASARPMDRLICGDVGFGKTEVALRAAFAATQNDKQVMVLCPTTILAQQHFANFRDRFEPFGVRVEVLSRFRTPEQQAAALAGFAEGEVSVLVGTHRLLSRDVNPHDLGLVVIDEEQRFGVGHKEQMKNLRETIDVLTLSATPIPRTMQMSLSGVRDMSLILTPPDERRPVKVHVGEWDPDVVSAAIRLELARGGQVYYVSNRVRSIDDAVARVRAAAEEARIGVAHGQMSREELEGVMEEFAAGELDVLVATTIIESGIDNPHTNTLIIEDSQRLGLAQMYQLKGRVGRSSTQAYAYFMFPDNVPLTEEAMARLTAIDEHTDLGSGMRIAMRDLEIRGAGSLLGAEQHGNMSAVGFDLFAQMLSQAVAATREGDLGAADGLPPALSDITVNVPGHTYLPEEYVPDADERVLWYRRIASAATVADVDALRADLEAKRPEMPPAAVNLMERARIKAFANEHGVKVVLVTGGRLVVEPIVPPRSRMKELRRAGARYLEDKRKLTLPLRYFKLEETDNLLGPVQRFLSEMIGAEAAEGDAAGDVARASQPVAESARSRRAPDATASQVAGGAHAAGSAHSAGGMRPRVAVEAMPHPREARPASARTARKARAVERGVAAKERLAEKRARRAQRGE